MKKLLLIALLFSSFFAEAQITPSTLYIPSNTHDLDSAIHILNVNKTQRRVYNADLMKWKLNISDTAAMLAPYHGGGGGGGTTEITQIYTGTSSVTVNNATTWLIINPATTSATTTITLPATPTDMQKIEISFGGTVTSGAVVTSFTIAPNSGQSILGTTSFGTVEVMDKITLRYNSTNSKWY